MSEIIDKERAICSYLHFHNDQMFIAYCNLAHRYVLKMFFTETQERLCLHCDTIEQEREEMETFINTEAKYIYFEHENGRIQKLPMSEFEYSNGKGYLEHKKENIAINLHELEFSSFTYTYDERGEISDRYILRNVFIY